MFNDELSALLRKKMSAEQEDFRGWLVKQPAEEILKHARQYAVREDILEAAMDNDLPENKAVALLKLREPLKAVFDEFENRDKYNRGAIIEALLACSDKAAGRDEKRQSIREQLKADSEGVSSPSPAKQKGQVR